MTIRIRLLNGPAALTTDPVYFTGWKTINAFGQKNKQATVAVEESGYRPVEYVLRSAAEKNLAALNAPSVQGWTFEIVEVA